MDLKAHLAAIRREADEAICRIPGGAS